MTEKRADNHPHGPTNHSRKSMKLKVPNLRQSVIMLCVGLGMVGWSASTLYTLQVA